MLSHLCLILLAKLKVVCGCSFSPQQGNHPLLEVTIFLSEEYHPHDVFQLQSLDTVWL